MSRRVHIPRRSSDGHPATLLVVDLINPFDYPQAEDLLRHALPAAERVARLIGRARGDGVPVVFVNDNFGRWRSSFEETRDRCTDGPGGDIVALLDSRPTDYHVLKPHRSGFYATPLELLLQELGTTAVVLAGVTTDMCVLSTAHDATLRKLDVTVVADGCAAMTEERHRMALELLQVAYGVAVADTEDEHLFETDGRGGQTTRKLLT